MGAYIELSEDSLVRAYEDTGSCVQVAKMFGVSKKTILNRFKKYGVTLTGRRTLESYKDKILELVRDKSTAKEASESLGVTRCHANKIARFHGVTFIDTFHKGYATTKSGYRLIRMPTHHEADSHGCVREHRYIAEGIIGRHLKKNEVVHHINGNKGDNRPDNLQVMDSVAHVKLHHIGKEGRGKDLKPRKNSRQRKDMI